MPVTTNTITVTINGVDKTSSLLKDSLFVRLQQNSKANTAELKFKNYDPPERSEVEILINGIIVFGGFIVRKSATVLGVANSHAVQWNCECKDWAELFDTVKVDKQYVGKSDLYIINDLLYTYLEDPTTGLPFIELQGGLPSVNSSLDITFQKTSLTEALNQLAKRVSANWYVRPNKLLTWFDKNNGIAADFGISSNPNNTTTFGFLNNSLSYEVDSSTIINQIRIVGGLTSNGEKIQDASNVGDGTNKKFALEHYPNSIAYVGWNDGFGVYTSYGSFIGYAPQDKLRSNGGNYFVVCDQNAKTISIEGPTGLAPANGSSVEIHYYKKEFVESVYDDLQSQSLFGVFPFSIENKEFTSVEASEQLANSLLEQNAYGKTSVKFETTKYGLLPGQLVQVDITELEIYGGWVNDLLQLENDEYLLLENNDFILLESYALGRTFIVQEVSLQPVLTDTNQFMIVCQVTAGKYTPNIIDSLATVSELKSSAVSNNSIPTRLSNISSDLGEVQIGRAVFTDGGTARFNWGTPNLATGLVLGLEDRSSLQGAMYIYDAGTVRVKLGNLSDMPAMGTITPSGWGIYTENGFFTGVVAASQLIGGTVTGALIAGNVINGGTINGGFINGGTVSASKIEGGTITSASMIAGYISSGTISAVDIRGNTLTGNSIVAGTITGNQITGGTVSGTRITGGSIVGNTVIGGTIATGTPPINSSNPGVYLDSTGLYGYGSAGLTFRLASDPAIKPYFSSGTITEVVYEVSTNSVIRTGITNPRIQIDNSGIFAYNSGGALKFSVDTASGLLTANGGNFSGTVTASKFTGGTIESGTINGNQINGGTISAGLFTGGTVTAGTVSSSYIDGGTVIGALVSGGTISSVGGSVTLDNTNGITIATQSSYNKTDSRSIKFNTSGSTRASIGATTAGVIVVNSGVINSQVGGWQSSVFGTASSESYFSQAPTAMEFWFNSVPTMALYEGTVYANANIIPSASSNNRLLGTAGYAFRYLYLKDDNGNDRRISINSSGVLTVT